MYEFLSQIVDYSDAELEKMWAFTKGLIPNLKTVNITPDIDISSIPGEGTTVLVWVPRGIKQ